MEFNLYLQQSNNVIINQKRNFVNQKGKIKAMLERKYEYGYYTVYLNGEFLTTCDSYEELREVYSEYGITI